ncbi:DUF7373 family lipoprotein [Nocardia arthritidis]|uniref:Uncharacterized protein n=1 Tax=Nocardia arthritidis TaxID=228602 RepID=A0A6G9Y767_9NOCA|nr:hypothetical protein [Nocardia arthritidis]QIS09061.1 hypothetical protein F5544_05745 [Nocardia arthritidis]
MASALVIALALAVGGCGSDDSHSDTEPAVPIDQLDVGNYPTQPTQLGAVKNQTQARLVEAERLANFVPLAMDIDPRFVIGAPFVSTVWTLPEVSLGKIMNVDRFAEAAPDFVGGVTSFGSTERNNRGIDLANAVMIFPDEQKATAAAAALEKVDFEANDRNTPVGIPKYPDAHAHWWPERQSIGSWYATGKYVVYTWIYDYKKIYLNKVDQPTLVALVEKSLDTVVPAIAKFTPTPVDQLMNAQFDLDGMLARTLPRPRDDSWLNPPGAYNAHAAVLFDEDQAESRKHLEEAGVDRFAVEGTQLYRTRDAASAKLLQSTRGGLTKKFKSRAAPRNLPAANCQEYIGREALAVRFYCSVHYDRYAAFSWSEQLLDAQQRISAQYALLENAK